MIKKDDQAGTELPTELRTALAKAKMPNGETAYVELSLEGQRRLTTAVGTNVQILPDDVVARHRDEKDIKWMSLNRLMRLKTEERKEADFLDRLSTASAPEVVVFAKWVLEQAPAHDLTIAWGDAGPLLKYEDADSGHSFTLGQLSWRGRLSSTQRFSRRIQRLGLDASIYQGYLDQVAALIPGATRRRFRSPSGKEWEQVATSESPNKGIPRLDPLVTHGPEWFAIIDATVRKIRAALENRDDSADEGGIDLKKDDERSEATPKEYWECEVGVGDIRTAEAGVAALRASAAQGDADAQFNLGVMYAEGYGVTQDYVEAGAWYRLAADQGDAKAQFNLGVMYAEGYGVPQDAAEAVAWYRLAAEQGDPDAQTNLGGMYAEGRGVPQDAAEAVAWYRLAAERGDPDAQTNLGTMYAEGRGVPQNDVEAVVWHRLAAEQGHANAQNNLGVSCATGNGVPQDYDEAVAWFRLAAEQGHADAQNNLGVSCATGNGVPQDYDEAVAWHRLAAEQGHADAQNNLGVSCATGNGVPQDYDEAVAWHRLAAEQGHADAQNNLGGMYAEGRGVPQNDVEAVVWYHLAAEQGHADAQNNLGVSCATGNGVPQDYDEAVAWFRQAAEQGHADAQFNLGVSYATGEGVPQDNVEALMWHILADFRSTGKARERTEPARNGVAAQMTPADISEANRRAREWHEAHPVP